MKIPGNPIEFIKIRREPMGPEDRLTVRLAPALHADFARVAAMLYSDMTALLRTEIVPIARELPEGYLPKPMMPPAYTRPGWDDKATAQLQVRLPVALIETLDSLAEASGVSRSVIVRWLIVDIVADWLMAEDLCDGLNKP